MSQNPARKKGPSFVPTGRVIKYPPKCALFGTPKSGPEPPPGKPPISYISGTRKGPKMAIFGLPWSGSGAGRRAARRAAAPPRAPRAPGSRPASGEGVSRGASGGGLEGVSLYGRGMAINGHTPPTLEYIYSSQQASLSRLRATAPRPRMTITRSIDDSDSM